MTRTTKPPTRRPPLRAGVDRGLRAYVRGYLGSQRVPTASGDIRFTARRMRDLLIESAIACLQGERPEAFVIALARQLLPEAERTDDSRLQRVLLSLGRLTPGQTVQGFPISRLLAILAETLT
jgi:hypothetical protein